jgi:hypothetical protein
MSAPQDAVTGMFGGLFDDVLGQGALDGLFTPEMIDEFIKAKGTSPSNSKRPIKGTSPIKLIGGRRNKYQMAQWYADLYTIVREIQPASVRQVYYQCVVRGLVEKTEAEYKSVAKALAHLRRTGEMPYDWLADSTRWMRRPRSHNGLQEAIEQTARFYRRDALTRSDRYIEVWLEKDALSGVVVQETEKFDVPLMVARGFASLSFLHSSAETIRYEDRPTTIFHLGDYDPSGQQAARSIRDSLFDMSGRDDLEFIQLAVMPEQIDQWNLPSRPTKTKGNSHAKGWEGDSTELDAIHPSTLRNLVGEAIAQHLPMGEINALRIAEESEREALKMFATELGDFRDKARTLNKIARMMKEGDV